MSLSRSSPAHAKIRPQALRLLGSGKAYLPELLALMTQVELLSELSGRDAEMLAHYLQAYAADPGCVIFSEGEPGHYMCLLASGRIASYKESDIAHRAQVGDESRGRSVGEMALIDGEPRSATCVAAEASVLLLLSQAAFQRLVEERPALALKLVLRIAKLMSRRLRLTSGRLVDYLDT